MNILLIITDQQIYSSMHDDFPIRLNAISRLKKEGRIFNYAFTPIAQCVPARNSLLTGLLPHAHGMYSNRELGEKGGPSQSLWMYTKELQKNGYLVGQVGKWHISDNSRVCEHGVDDYITDPPAIKRSREEEHMVNAPIFVREQLERGAPQDNIFTNKAILSGSVSRPPEDFREYTLISEAIELMDKYQSTVRPWHMRVEFIGPHTRWIVPEAYDNLIDPDDIKIPDNFFEDFHNKPTIQKRQHRDYNLCSCYHDVEWTRRNLVRYYGLIKFIDDQINRLLEHMDELGVSEDTLVIFTSDHGDLSGSHNRIGKGELPYDELYRIAMLARWPGHIKPGTKCDEFIMLHDLASTMLSLAGITVPENLHARDLSCLFTGDESEYSGCNNLRKEIIMEHHGTMQPLMIRIFRDKVFKYVLNPFDRDEFYDLGKDPGELENIIEDPAYSETVKEYRDRFRSGLVEVKDKWLGVSKNFLYSKEE